MPPLSRLAALVAMLLLARSSASAALQLSGRVVDENGAVVAGAKITLSKDSLINPLIVTSDDAGRFVAPLTVLGSYGLRVEKPGFYAFVSSSFPVEEKTGTVEVVLNHRQEFEETVSVEYSTPVVDRQEAAITTSLTSEEILDLPVSASHDFQRTLPLIPGVVRDLSGKTHLNGGGENQTYYSLDGFNIASPVSGVLEGGISVDAIRSLSVSTSRYSAEYGKGSAGVLELETARGDDHFRFTSTDFFPSFEFRNGLVLKSWGPRASFSGPIVRGRAWFFNATDVRYDLNIVDELPHGANTGRDWFGNNLSRFQVNLTHRNILTAGLLFNFENATHLGISPLDPIETSRNRHERFYFVNIKDQAYFGSGWVLETGAAINQLNTREVPQGNLPYKITPLGRSGSFFLSSQGRAQRIQVLVNVLTPRFNWLGSHSLKFGLSGDGISYHQLSNRRSYEVWRQTDTLARRVVFIGNPSFRRDSSEFSGFLQDRWVPRERVFVDAGVRFDWDQIMRTTMISPRAAVTWGPARWPESKFSAGIGIFYDAINMGLLTRDLDQQRVDTFYAEDGNTIRGGPVLTRYLVYDRLLEPPFYVNWSLGWEQKLPMSFYLRTNYIWKHGRHGWSYDLESESGTENTYRLASSRRDRYSYLELSLTRRFKQKYSWLVSYARSSARSSAVIDFSLDNPMIGRQGSGRMGWDAPNRFISWAAFPAPVFSKYLLSYFVEWHSGFPFSAVNEIQQLVGTPNSHEFPEFFSANFFVERRFRFLRFEWAFRAGCNNVAGRRNPVVVNNDIDSGEFGQFRGGQARVFAGRIRLLGRT